MKKLHDGKVDEVEIEEGQEAGAKNDPHFVQEQVDKGVIFSTGI